MCITFVDCRDKMAFLATFLAVLMAVISLSSASYGYYGAQPYGGAQLSIGGGSSLIWIIRKYTFNHFIIMAVNSMVASVCLLAVVLA